MTAPDGAAGSPLVLFVCRHGSARSILAAADLQHAADAAGFEVRAVAAGIEPDDAIAIAVRSLLSSRAPAIPDRPRRVTAGDIEAATLTVTFNLVPNDLPGTPARMLAWDDVPAVSEEPRVARSVIGRHLEELLPLLDAVRDDG